MLIWANTHGALLRVQRHIQEKNADKAQAELQIARLWFLFALKKYLTWKEGIEAAGAKMQLAIAATAALIVAAAGAAAIAGAAATTGATTTTVVTAQPLVRVAASVAQAESAIQLPNLAESEGQILAAIEEAVKAAAEIP